MCGIGVTSLMDRMVIPAACIDLMADSRPAPGPFTLTSTSLTPRSAAFLAAVSAAIPAAKGVDFFDPLNPELPVDAHAIVLPSLSVMVTMVLLNVARMCATPLDTARASFFVFFTLLFLFSTVFWLRPFCFLSYDAYGFTGSLPRPRVGPCPLAADRQASPVP